MALKEWLNKWTTKRVTTTRASTSTEDAAPQTRRALMREMRAGLPPMSGRQWVKLRKYMQREAAARMRAARPDDG